jgi:hypothetical protein
MDEADVEGPERGKDQSQNFKLDVNIDPNRLWTLQLDRSPDNSIANSLKSKLGWEEGEPTVADVVERSFQSSVEGLPSC